MASIAPTSSTPSNGWTADVDDSREHGARRHVQTKLLATDDCFLPPATDCDGPEERRLAATSDAPDALPRAPLVSMSRLQRAESFCGVVYVCLSVVLSAYYLTQLSPNLTNDLWWPDLNSSGAQSYLVDAVNARMQSIPLDASPSPVVVDLFDPALAIQKDYSRAFTPIPVHPAYARALLYTRRTDFEAIIPLLRSPMASPDNVFTQYCWLDFNKTLETAHTDARQARCRDRYTANAAVYWESSLRNVNWSTWAKAYGSAEGSFTTTIVKPINRTNATAADAFLKAISSHNMSAMDQAAMWRARGVTYFHISFQNLYAAGIVDTMEVVNALGMVQTVTLKRTDYVIRSSGWSSVYMNWLVYNDLAFSLVRGFSIVRSDSANQRFHETCPNGAPPSACPSSKFDLAFGLSGTSPLVNATRRGLGPYGSVDMLLLKLPPQLAAFVTAVQGVVTTEMQKGGAFYDVMMTLPPLAELDPAPLAWTTMLPRPVRYMGGDPTCPFRTPRSFVQPSWAFDVSCGVQTPHTIKVNMNHALFATLATKFATTGAADTSGGAVQISTVCSQCPTRAALCQSVLATASQAFVRLSEAADTRQLRSMAVTAQAELGPLNISTIQFAVDAGDGVSVSVLQQLILNPPRAGAAAAAWNFFGWVFLHDWVMGLREVVSFEGDVNSFVLMSEPYAPQRNLVQPLEVPSSACQYLWWISVYVTVVLVVVGAVVVVYGVSVRFCVVGRNLMQLNRVVGSVWVGRPFMLVRGAIAVILLSTSRVQFVRKFGFSRFESPPRPFVATLVVSGEATWVTYVLHDVLLVALDGGDHNIVRGASVVSWVILVALETVAPVKARAVFNRVCVSEDLQITSDCTSCRLEFGSLDRAYVLLAIQLGVVVAAVGLAKAWRFMHRASCPPTASLGAMLLPGAALAFLDKGTPETGSSVWFVDQASCAMCGLLTFRDYIFDVKLWSLVKDCPANSCRESRMKIFRPPVLLLRGSPRVDDIARANHVLAVQSSKRRSTIQFVAAIAGCFYMAATIAGSASFILVANVNMANDFWWASFNATGIHAYISNWYQENLNYFPARGVVHLDDAQYWDRYSYADNFTTTVQSRLYASTVQSTDLTAIEPTIHGLRRMSGCLLPWISTQYCWVDFERTWAMASSAARQDRCAQRATYRANGAVYLESVLRNAEWTQLRSCWGTALDTAIATELQSTTAGATWWANVQQVTTTVAEEVDVWTGHGVVSFETTWQNFKTLGIVETYGIQNAFGLQYDMTLKYTNSSFTLAGPSSFRAYWGLASDLWAVAAPSTLLTGQSLVRSSSRFAFANSTATRVLAQNGTLDWPLNPAFMSLQRLVGPIGSIDLKYVGRPASVVRYIEAARDMIRTAVRASPAATNAFRAITTPSTYTPLLQTWGAATAAFNAGGNILCPAMRSNNPMRRTMSMFLGPSSGCNYVLGEYIAPSVLSNFYAVLGAGLVRRDLTAHDLTIRCQLTNAISVASCVKSLNTSVQFLLNASYIPPDTVAALTSLAGQAQADVAQLNVEIAQWTTPVATSLENVTLAHEPIFGPNKPLFAVHAWQLILEWAQLRRDVVAIDGDSGSLTVLTTGMSTLSGALNPLEVPLNVAYYMRNACIYVTGVIGLVAAIAMLYAIVGRCQVEGWNLMEINRIAGVLWVGRPLLFLRSMTAIALLSTGSLELVQENYINFLVQKTSATSSAYQLFATILASGEVSWLVYVIHDILIVFTQQYTIHYAPKCSMLVWGLAAALSIASPVTYLATISRQCSAEAVDFQLRCSSGVVSIGSPTRFWQLVGLCFVSIVVCYGYDRLRYPNRKPSSPSSLFLPSCAKFLFESANWVEFDVYHMDMASAAIAGILSIPHANGFYLLDIKTWKLYPVQVQDGRSATRGIRQRQYLHDAIPLTD